MVKKLDGGKTIFVAMSGGVDSSVAALLLKNQGYDVVGVFMRCYNLDGCSERDAVDARRVAEKLNIPFHIWDFEEEYKKKVVEYMIDGYRRGITPNPDVMCNKEIKFGLFLKKALEMGADFVATGHYVRKREVKNQKSKIKITIQNSKLENSLLKTHYSLLVGRDSAKDQSYFLWTLTQEQLKHCLFPIGDYLKSEVREIARKAGLPTAEKKDSQGICFLGKITLDEFLANYIPEKRGAVLSVAGEKIGEHKGAHFYTIGQRHINAEIRNPKTEIRKDRQPYYVAEKDIKTNTLVVAEGDDNPALYKKEIELTDVNFVNYESGIMNYELKIPVLARVRYRQPLSPALFIIHNSPKQSLRDATGQAKFIIQFDAPVKSVAPGQSAVFYAKNGEMLGGGIIL